MEYELELYKTNSYQLTEPNTAAAAAATDMKMHRFESLDNNSSNENSPNHTSINLYSMNNNNSNNNSTTSKRQRIIYILSLILVLAIGTIIGLAYAYNSKSSSINSPIVNEQQFNTAESLRQLGIEIDSVRDLSINPCDDFYQYACNQWMQNTPLPSDSTRWSRSFDTIYQRNLLLLKSINEANWPVLGSFYQSCMNAESDSNTVKSFELIKTDLVSIESIDNINKYFLTAGTLVNTAAILSLFNIRIETAPYESNKNILILGQGGLSLRSLNSYNNIDTINNYTDHITKIFRLAGDNPDTAKSNAELVVNIEKLLSTVSLPPAELRDPLKTYNPITFGTLKTTYTNIPWSDYFTAAKIPITADPAAADSTMISIDVPKFFQSLNTYLDSSNLQFTIPALKQYLRWKLIHSYSGQLGAEVELENFNFFSKYVNGQESQPVRWKKCTAESTALLGDITGRYYIAAAFNTDSQLKTTELIKQIRIAMDETLNNIDWMSPDTIKAAKSKLTAIIELVGSPSNWTDYSSVYITKDQYLSNVRSLRVLDTINEFDKLNKPVDKQKWQMTQSIVNAYYDPSFNSINFPAGILQSPFFNSEWPQSMNYAGIGMVMGHEIIHGFDDQGSRYNGAGVLSEWWTATDRQKFTNRAQCLIDQYNNYWINSTIGSDRVNGELTLGENIADNGGLGLAYRAYHNWLSINNNNDPIPSINQLTNVDQLFFLSFAQSWCRIQTDQSAQQLVQTDPHSPSQYRVNGPLQNNLQFATAYNCPIGSKMNPQNKCKLW